MDAYLNLPDNDRRIFCQQAAAQKGIPAVSIEKDFWVTWTLQELFTLPGWGEHLAFKGGTSLSKGWKLIERFSEDIDVVIDRGFLGFEGHLSVNKLNKLKEECSRRIHTELYPALKARLDEKIGHIEGWTLEPADKSEDPDQQTLLFRYPTVFEKATYLRPVVKIEMGARSDTEPSEEPVIQAFLCELFPAVLGEGTFSVRTVAARRTFWDKAMLLHEEIYRPQDKPRKRSYARHYYDLWSLIKTGIADQAVADAGLFEKIAEHRQGFFRYSWMNYETLRPGHLRLIPLDHQMPGWQSDYHDMKEEMFYGEVPEFERLLSDVREFQESFNATASEDPSLEQPSEEAG